MATDGEGSVADCWWAVGFSDVFQLVTNKWPIA